MNRSRVCLLDFGSDIALTLMLKSWELKSWLYLLDFASSPSNTAGDSWVIPASKRGRLRLWMRLGRDEEKFEKRLAVFAGEADLIELRQDGSIFIKWLEEQSWLEGDEEDDYPRNGDYDGDPDPGYGLNGNGLNANGLNGLNGNGSSGSNGARTRNQRYSMEYEAVRRRERRRRQKNQSPEQRSQNGENGSQNGNVPGNIPPFESKCPAPHADMSQEMSQEMSQPKNGQMSHLGRDMSGTSLAGVSPNVNVSSKEDYKIISDSGDVNVAAKPMSQNVPPQNVPRNVPPATQSASSAPSVPRVPVRPGFAEVDAQVQMMQDVKKAIGLAHDAKSRGFYQSVWRHCYSHGSMACWDMALETLADKIAFETQHGAPPGHPDHFPQAAYGKSLNKTLMNMLRDNGTPFPQGTAAERAAAQAEIKESLAAGSGVPPPGEITPLESIYPEMEDE